MTKTFVVFSFDAAIVTRVARIVVVTFLRPAGRIVRRRRMLVVVVVVVGQTAAVIVIITTVNQIKSNPKANCDETTSAKPVSKRSRSMRSIDQSPRPIGTFSASRGFTSRDRSIEDREEISFF
jgi:hypothetical protein